MVNTISNFQLFVNNDYYLFIVGAGSAGSIIATRLSEDRTNVLLLEAGGSDLENEFTRIPLQWLRTLWTKENWSFDTVPQKYSVMSEGSRVRIHYNVVFEI